MTRELELTDIYTRHAFEESLRDAVIFAIALPVLSWQCKFTTVGLPLSPRQGDIGCGTTQVCRTTDYLKQ